MVSKKIVLIPAYKPTYNLIDLVSTLKKKSLIIIVVDDGSGIKYKDILKETKKYAEVLSYEENKGKGNALKLGFNYIKKKYVTDYVVVTMDSDGQHSVEDAIKLLEYSLKNKNQLVLGKRLRDENIPLRSKLGNSVTRFLYHLITKQDIYDTQTGLRSFTDELMTFMLGINGERFEYEMNVLLECARNKNPIKELEIKTIYIDNNSHSHFKTIEDSFLVYKEMLKFSLNMVQQEKLH